MQKKRCRRSCTNLRRRNFWRWFWRQRRRRRMGIAVTFCAQTEHERRENENHHSLFRGSEKESLSDSVELGTPASFNHESTGIKDRFARESRELTQMISFVRIFFRVYSCDSRASFFVIPSAFVVRISSFLWIRVHSWLIHWLSGVVTSVPGGGVNSNVDGGTGARLWFE